MNYVFKRTENLRWWPVSKHKKYLVGMVWLEKLISPFVLVTIILFPMRMDPSILGNFTTNFLKAINSYILHLPLRLHSVLNRRLSLKPKRWSSPALLARFAACPSSSLLWTNSAQKPSWIYLSLSFPYPHQLRSFSPIEPNNHETLSENQIHCFFTLNTSHSATFSAVSFVKIYRRSFNIWYWRMLDAPLINWSGCWTNGWGIPVGDRFSFCM